VWGPALPPLVVVVLLGAGVFALDRLFPDALFLQGRVFARHRSELEVTESRMNWVQTKDGLRIFVTGLLTNPSAAAWQSLEFECRFFDTHGAMIDAANARGLLTVAANAQSAFRVSVVPGSASNAYASFATAVSTARSSRAPF